MLLKSLAALVLLAPVAAMAATSGASDAASSWLALVDKGAYADSWTAAGGLFKSQITADKWAMALKSVREPLGAVASRKLATETETASLPGAPAGHYDVITFTTSFASKSGATETVVMAEEPAGWKPIGYFIK